MITQLTEAQVRDNLRNLSTYLKNTAPKDKNADFDMGTFCKVTPSYLLEPNECGTVACSIGHYALMIGWDAAGQGAKPKDRTLESDGGMTISPSGYMFWNDFCTNVIGVAKETHADLVLWRWLFSSDWQYVDGTALGAAARIDYYLINGVPKELDMEVSLIVRLKW